MVHLTRIQITGTSSKGRACACTERGLGALDPSWIGAQRLSAPFGGNFGLISGGRIRPPPGAVAMQKAHGRGGAGYFGPLVSFTTGPEA